METCNACKGPKRDPRYRACAKCREGWRLDKGLTYQKKTVPVESYQKAVEAAYAEGFKIGQESMRERAAKVCPDRTGHEWVHESLWDRVAQRMEQLIGALTIDELSTTDPSVS